MSPLYRWYQLELYLKKKKKKTNFINRLKKIEKYAFQQRYIDVTSFNLNYSITRDKLDFIESRWLKVGRSKPTEFVRLKVKNVILLRKPGENSWYFVPGRNFIIFYFVSTWAGRKIIWKEGRLIAKSLQDSFSSFFHITYVVSYLFDRDEEKKIWY